MQTIALSDAKTKLSALIGDVRVGMTYEITHYGKAVARLVPVQTHSPDAAAAAWANLHQAAKSVRSKKSSRKPLKALIHEGHRW
jgi:antitoxin (DNA-binding transcriptional repressor) of toxin-antitoxin stability system